MDTTFHIDYVPEHSLSVYRPIGALTGEHSTELFYFLLGAEAVAPAPFNRLVDLSGVTEFPLESSLIHAFASVRAKAVAHLPRVRTAILAPSFDGEIVARLYASLMYKSQISVEVFRDASSAAAWLGVPDSVVQTPVMHHS